MPDLVPIERIENKIYVLRGKKVMLDRDLAALYGVKTHVMNQSVRRNIDRFPEDFMFRLTSDEWSQMSSQIVMTSKKRPISALPFAFTEEGVAMLSGVLKSKRAIAVHIQIIRTFTKLREIIAGNDYLLRKLETMEKQYDEQFRVVFDALRRLLSDDDDPKPEIGFRS